MWWETVIVLLCVAGATAWVVRSLARDVGGKPSGCGCAKCPATTDESAVPPDRAS